MLVLSRRRNEKILLPSINTSVEVISIKGGAVRLGIQAPPEVPILRAELQGRTAERSASAPRAETPEGDLLRALRHFVRNRLNAVNIGLAVLRNQVGAGWVDDAQRTISVIEMELKTLQQQFQGAAAKPATPPQTARKPRKALLVEDDQNERELLAGFLRMSGFDVNAAGDGGDALDYLRAAAATPEKRPDFVLLDMALPRCDGPTTVREIRRDPAWAQMRIFAVSGHSPDEYDLKLGPGGIDRWFSKPLDPVALLRELNRELSV